MRDKICYKETLCLLPRAAVAPPSEYVLFNGRLRVVAD